MNSSEIEEWRPIVGYEGRYKVSNLGRVAGHWHRWPSMRFDRIIKPQSSKRGYPLVALNDENGRRRSHRIHRLVAIAFLGHPVHPNIEVNHKDGNKRNNKVSNLEWCTRQHNVAHSFKTGLHKVIRGENVKGSKLKEADIIWIRETRKTGATYKTIAGKLGVSDILVGLILRGKAWTHVKQKEAA